MVFTADAKAIDARSQAGKALCATHGQGQHADGTEGTDPDSEV